MEASIMDGPGRRCGAVFGLTTVKNPVSLARLVMDKSPHSYIAFSGAEKFAKQMVFIFYVLLEKSISIVWENKFNIICHKTKYLFLYLKGVETVENDYFITQDNVEMLKLAKEANFISVCALCFQKLCLWFCF